MKIEEAQELDEKTILQIPYFYINILAGILIALIIFYGVPWIYLPFFSLVALIASYNTIIFIYSFFYGRMHVPKVNVDEAPKVAILYLTYNDFNEDAFRTLKELTYQNKEIIVVDDSTDEGVRRKVDSLGYRVIRRNQRRGFKAGAVNNALRHIDADYIAIMDADEKLPRDFIEKALQYFSDENVAFVQATHRGFNRHNTWTKAMCKGVDAHWYTYHKYRNSYGVVNFLGHGAIIKRSALDVVGGFPEVVAEDIALTVELYRKGYHGIFADEIICFEDVPATYEKFRKRHKKWTMGSIEFLKKYFVKIMLSNMRWYEKEDLFISVVNLPLAGLFTLFVILYVFMPAPATPPLTILTLLAILSPMLPLIRLRDFWSVFINALAFMSLFPVTMVYLIKGVIKPEFLVTGTATKKDDVYIDVVFGTILTLITPYFINPIGFSAMFVPVYKRIWK